MLNKIRKFSSGLFIKIILILIIAAMVLWGIGDNNKAKKYHVASIDNEHYIHTKDFIRSKRNFVYSFNKNYPSISLDAINVNKIVLDNLIRNKLLEIEADRLGLLVSNDVAADQIRNLQMFKDKQGRFSKEIFKQILLTNELSEAEYVKSVKNDLASQAIFSMVSEFTPSKHFANSFHRYNAQKRIVDLVVIKPQKKPIAAIKISSGDIEKYYEENKAKFTVPELRDVEYIVITPSDFKSEVEISDAELEDTVAELEESAESDKKPVPTNKKEAIKANLISQKAEQLMHEKMKDIEDDLAAGDSLTDIAAKFNLKYVTVKQVNQEGNFDSISIKIVPQNIKKLLKDSFDLEKNNPSDALQIKENSSDYYILNVKSIYPAAIRPLSEVSQDITFLLQKENKEKQDLDRAKNIYEQVKVSKEQGLKKLQEEYPQQISVETMTLSRPNDQAKEKSQKIPSDILVNLFNFKDIGEMTGIFKTNAGDFAFIVLKEIISSKEKPFDTEMKKVSLQLSNFVTSLVQQEFMQYLDSKHKIQIFEETLQNL